MSQYDELLEKAYEQALRAYQINEVPVGAIVLKDNQVIGVGHNLKESTHCSFHHAEMMAIQKASERLRNWRLMDCVLVSTLEPCPMCMAACQQARISRCIYGAKDLKGGAISLGYNLHQNSKLNHQFEVIYSEFKKGSEILKEFFSKKR